MFWTSTSIVRPANQKILEDTSKIISKMQQNELFWVLGRGTEHSQHPVGKEKKKFIYLLVSSF